LYNSMNEELNRQERMHLEKFEEEITPKEIPVQPESVSFLDVKGPK